MKRNRPQGNRFRFLAALVISVLFYLPAFGSAQVRAQGAIVSQTGSDNHAALPAVSIKPAPQVNARSAALIDATTGTLLYAKNPDLSLPPASLTKLLTLHIAYEEIEAGRLSLDEILEIDKRDCSPYIPYGSSIMYLHPGMKVSVRDLMLGAAVVSGNDAAYALARRISGSNEAFAERMNREMEEMGFDKLSFVEPSGLSEFSLVTARQFAQFCKRYLELHPESLEELHSVRYIEFPREEHRTPTYLPEGRIVQYNRNSLITSYPGSDGLKTGYIIEVGFNMAATAKRGDSRFIVITLGGTGSSYAGGGRQRTQDVARLLDWAFENFTTQSIDAGELPTTRVWFGSERQVGLKSASANAVTVPKGREGELSLRVEAEDYVDGPIEKGRRLGRLVYSLSGKDVAAIDLVAEKDIPRAGFFRRFVDAVGRFFTKLFSKDY
ncbi:MAG: D-alanyl-D-alanine carboxypeptidase family protein [Spirochaetia bacterium]|jgi:D-alanyl-D-alanine carboxypeptidase (penicillin-binding protein 5/6)|nr:D-alanyl-D-alanine carboxypeptidase family protein [Spirochaetia bacterium]